MVKFEKNLRSVLNVFRQLGLDPLITIRALRSVARYSSDLRKFKTLASQFKLQENISISPALLDFTQPSGAADGHYFWQDLYCAQWINSRNPTNHLDIGSRIDGFVAHLLASREVTVLDIRKLESKIPNLNFMQMDLQYAPDNLVKSFDSVSSLHSIEHFGLGRYGDLLEIDGHTKGLVNISKLVNPDGYLYISFPIGESEIQFNQQRIIDPTWPIDILEEFELQRFMLIPWRGSPRLDVRPEEVDKSKFGQAGLYEFRRTK